MKKQVSEELVREYQLPKYLTDFQLNMFIHLIKWKREHITGKNGYFRGMQYGAILPDEFVKKGCMFYPAVFKEIQKHDFKKHIHINHMASSQAACLNLFLPILSDNKIANTVLPKIIRRFVRLATEQLESGFQFEFWDKSNPLRDHTPKAGTDSDVAIAYYDINGDLSLWLIEHKFTEDEFTQCGGFHRSSKNQTKNYCKDGNLVISDNSRCYLNREKKYKYWEFTDEQVFNRDVLKKKNQCPFIDGTNQLWRNQILGKAIIQKGDYKNVHFSVVMHPDNPDLQPTINNYVNILKDKSVFSVFTSRDIINNAMKLNNPKIDKWVKWYKDLYKV